MNHHEPARTALQYVNRAGGCQPRWREKVDKVLDTLLPARCVVCGLHAPSSGLCPGCRDGLPHWDSACPLCGLPVTTHDSAPCGACLANPPAWDGIVAGTWYRFPVRQLVQGFKYRRNLAAGHALTQVLQARLASTGAARPHLVVPVPLHRWRLLGRGFNQAYEIARPLSRAFGLGLAVHDLRRTRHTPRQSGLDAQQRRHNLDRAFQWRGSSLQGQQLALVDDVMTTGSTVSECVRVLKRAGAARVHVWVLARAPRPG